MGCVVEARHGGAARALDACGGLPSCFGQWSSGGGASRTLCCRGSFVLPGVLNCPQTRPGCGACRSPARRRPRPAGQASSLTGAAFASDCVRHEVAHHLGDGAGHLGGSVVVTTDAVGAAGVAPACRVHSGVSPHQVTVSGMMMFGAPPCVKAKNGSLLGLPLRCCALSHLHGSAGTRHSNVKVNKVKSHSLLLRM